MIIPTKKLKCGLEIPVYGLGLWEVGGRWESDSSKDEEEIIAIRAAIDAGVTMIDTAEIYGDGHAEELLGRAIDGLDRSKLFISTKVFGTNQGYEGTLNAFKKSKNRLGVDYVDLYLLHSYPRPGISIQDTMRALDELVESGQVRYIGVCNMTPERYNEAQKYSKNKIVYNQLHYNVQYREVEKYKLQQHAIDNDYLLCAWRPVQKGELPESVALKEIAEKYGKTTIQVAINWLVSQQNVITLSKTSNPEHLNENLSALDWTMDKEDIERIRNEFPNQKEKSDAVPLDYAGSDSSES